MSNPKWVIRDSTLAQFRAALSDLADDVSDLEMQWDGMSERWQNGDKGSEVQDRIAELGNLADEFETLIDKLAES